jgi:tetratricopeptide (TPR) repeat protein
MIDELSAAPPVAAPVERTPWQPGAWLSVLIVALSALAVYANSLTNGFAYDDDWIILRNDRVHQLNDLGLIWGTPYWPTFGNILGLYRPLAIFAYAIEWAIGAGAPWVYHVTSVALHTIVCVLVLLLLRRLVSARAALLGALIFAVHPVHVEAVANGVGQAELIAAVGVLMACVLYTRAGEQEKPSLLVLALLPVCYLGALFSKEASITLPALLVILDLAQRKLRLNARGIRAYLGTHWMLFFLLAATAVLYLSIRVSVLGSISGSDAAPGLPFLREEHRMLTAFRAWPEFIRLLLFPKDLSADYSPAVILPVESWTPMAVLGLAMILGFVALAFTLPARAAVGLPVAWFLISIVTVSNLFFPIGVVVAERTLYLPSVAVAFLVGFAWDAIEQKAERRRWQLAGVTAALALALMSFRTVQRNPEWKSTLAILNATVRDHPESYHTAWLLADQYWRRGDVAQSAFYWEAALRLWPRDSQLLLEFANFNIGRKNWKRAIELLEQSRTMHPWVPRVHEMLAFSYANANRPQEALASANEAFSLSSNTALMYAIRATAYDQLGRHNEAAGAWRVAVNHKRGSLWIYRAMLARALARAGHTEQALAALDSAATLLRNDSLALRVLASTRIAVVTKCYDPAGVDSSCGDPLAGWSLAVDAPPDVEPVADRRSKSQNATGNSSAR